MDQWINGAKLPKPPHINSFTPLHFHHHFFMVHQLKFSLHYLLERRTIGSMDQNCTILHISISLLPLTQLIIHQGSPTSITVIKSLQPSHTTCWSDGSLEHWIKIGPASTYRDISDSCGSPGATPTIALYHVWIMVGC